MTCLVKSAAFCATVILLGYTLEVLGYTLFMCKQDCKDEPDDPVCSRWNFTSDSGQRNNISDYEWLRNECERKCFQHGTYERVEDMDLCYQKGQTRTSYLCSKYYDPRIFDRCMRNESLGDYEE